MFNFTTNVPFLDRENEALFRASTVLEKIGNGPGLSTDDFYVELLRSDLPTEEHQSVTLAAIAIETMMSADVGYDSYSDSYKEPTIH